MKVLRPGISWFLSLVPDELPAPNLDFSAAQTSCAALICLHMCTNQMLTHLQNEEAYFFDLERASFSFSPAGIVYILKHLPQDFPDYR